MNDPRCFRIFLSSTFRDLRNERRAVEDTIHRMGDFFVGMEHFGSSPHSPLRECLNQVRSADLIVLVLGFRHGSVPRRQKRSMVEREYWEAKQNNIPILAYVADRERYEPKGEVNPRILEFREFLRERLQAPCFHSKDDLAVQVAADVGREIRRINFRFQGDSRGTLLFEHSRVVAALQRRDLKEAKKLNWAILQSHPYSPRAHYNHACILAQIAQRELDSDARVRLFRTSRGRLHDALKLGILDFIAIFADQSDPSNADPPTRVISDVDLEPLFQRWPELVDQVRAGYVIVERRSCSC